MAGDGIAVKGQAYGITSIRVDGNDALAIYDVVREARRIAVKEHKPVLIEVLIFSLFSHFTINDRGHELSSPTKLYVARN